VLAFSRRCLKLRSDSPALRLGSMKIVEAGEQLLRFERSHDGQRLLCSFNLSERPAPFRGSGSISIATGECSSEALGAFSAVIEDLG
jgi:alpha-glucosidase